MTVPISLLAGLEFGKTVGHSSGLTGALSSILFPTLDSLSNYRTQTGYYQYPIVPPPAGMLLDAYVKSWFEFEPNGQDDIYGFNDFVLMCRRNGVAVGDEGYNTTEGVEYSPYKRTWQRILNTMAVRPSIREAFVGKISGLLSDKEFERMLAHNGAKKDDWNWLFPFYSQRLNIMEVVELWKRGVFTDEQFEIYCKLLQYGVPSDIEQLKQLSNVIPGYTDVIRMAIREAFNPEQVKFLQLDQELDQNPDYLAVAKAAGLGEVKIGGLSKGRKSLNFAELYWYAHWDLPSPTMTYEFLHRYYKGSKYGDSPWLRYAKEFTIADARNLLKANDYSPAFRDHLIGLSYRPLGRIDVRRLYKAGIITEADVYHNSRVQGYADKEANELTQWIITEKDKEALNKVRLKTRQQACRAYTLGIIDQPRLEDILVKAGYNKQTAQAESNVCDISKSIDTAQEILRAIRSGYYTGVVDKREAELRLREAGFKDKEIDRYIYLWNLRLVTNRKVIAAQKLVDWFAVGILSIQELISRLFKLNYSEQDVTRIVKSAQIEASKRINRAQKIAAQEAEKQITKNLRVAEKQRRESERRHREIEREGRERVEQQRRTERDRLARFLSARTEANLRLWLREDQISESEVRETLRLKGWGNPDITRWLNIERERR